MLEPPPSQRTFLGAHGAYEIAGVALCGVTVATWAALAAGRFSLLALLACEAAFFAFYLAGSAVSAWRSLAAGILFDLPLKLLLGYAIVNTALFVLAWLSPLGIVANFAVVLALAAAAFVATRRARPTRRATSTGLLVIVIALAATTLWCQDSLSPIAVQGSGVRLKPWTDSFYHSMHIRLFSVAHGASSIQDFRMAGVPARLYHYAAYFTPALIKQASGLASYYAYAGILVPLGVFFTGLGAYVLVASSWGTWPGLAACGALLLLPDGAQQGMGNGFLSYHWLAQISPGATCGLAMIALAWLFMLRGCTRGSLLQVVAGWVFAGLVAVYKAQFFVAISVIMLGVPPIFLRGRLRLGQRLVWLGTALLAMIAAVAASQQMEGMPLIRLDGSSTGRMLDLVLSMTSGDHLLRGYVGELQPWIPNLVLGAPYLLLAILGLMGPLLVGLLWHLRRDIPRLLRLFPLFIAANFLVMALGLAFDSRHIGTPEELQHRPFLVMYFALAAWTGAAAALALLRSRRFGSRAKPVIAGLGVVLLAVPALGGPNLQSLRPMQRETNTRISPDLLAVMEYMRDHGSPDEVFQASSSDPTYMVAALADKQPYFDNQALWVRQSERPLMDERAAQVAQFMQLTEPWLLQQTAGKWKLRWFLLFPMHAVSWPASIADHPAFQAGPFKVYRFD